MRPKRGKKGQNLYAHIILQQRNGTDIRYNKIDNGMKEKKRMRTKTKSIDNDDGNKNHL